MKKIGVLISGRGSNMLALADAIHDGRIQEAEIAVVISNTAEAGGFAKAQERGIATLVLDHRGKKREEHDRAMAEELRKHAILAIVAVSIANANDVFVMNGPDIVGLRGSALAWLMLPLGIVGGIAIAGGLIAGLVAWIGALLNTWQLESKTWFAVLLLLGIFNFGFFAMVAFLVAGPDGRLTRPSGAGVTSRPTPA